MKDLDLPLAPDDHLKRPMRLRLLSRVLGSDAMGEVVDAPELVPPVSTEVAAKALEEARTSGDPREYERVLLEHLERVAEAVEVEDKADVPVMNAHEIGVFADVPCDFWRENETAEVRAAAWEAELAVDDHLDD